MSDFDDAWSRVSGRQIEPAAEPKVRERHDLVQPSEEEKRNGWTAETLTKYIRERERASYERIDLLSARRRRQQPQRASGNKWNFPAGTGWQVRGRNFGPWASRKRRERIKRIK